MSCSLLLTACGTKEPHFKPLPIPPEKIDCAVLIKRPPLTEEYKIDWATVAKAPNPQMMLQLAQLEVQKLMFSIRAREGQVANYVLNIEGILYGCSSDAEWMRDYTKKTSES